MAFWQHAAPEILGLPPAPSTSDFQSSTSSSTASASSLLASSSFLLDFLYPHGTLALMRRLASSPSLTYPAASSTDRLDSLRTNRAFPAAFAARSYSSAPDGHHKDLHGRESRDTPNPETSEMPARSDDPDNESSNIPPEEDNISDAVQARRLLALLAHQEPHEVADKVWFGYRKLPRSIQRRHTKHVIVFLAAAGRPGDAHRIVELFESLSKEAWDGLSFVATVRARIELIQDSSALSLFVSGLSHQNIDQPSLINALDAILTRAVGFPITSLFSSLIPHAQYMAARFDLLPKPWEVPRLHSLASVPDLADKVLEFVKCRDEVARDDDQKEAVDLLLKLLLRTALLQCPDGKVFQLLQHTQDPAAYEQAILEASRTKRYKVALDVYKIWRGLPNVASNRRILHSTFQAVSRMTAYPSDKFTWVEMLWADWHRLEGHPSRRAYQKFMALYASKGDKKRVMAMWTEYMRRFSKEHDLIKDGDDTFSHLLQMHAVLGETAEVERIMRTMRDDFKVEPGRHAWNIAINAYVKANDYDGVMDLFGRLLQVHKPDQYTFATVMQMAAIRGDLRLVTDLYQQMRRHKIKANDAILNSLVDVYCENDQLSGAFTVCQRATAQGIKSTRMWNKLLYHHAVRHDLLSINAHLKTMSDNAVPYNEQTYKQLLLGLSLSRQPNHALHLLTLALRANMFHVTSDHFYVVMGALLKSGQYKVVMRLQILMQDYGISQSSGIVFRVIEALAQARKASWHPRKQAQMTAALGSTLRQWYEMYGLSQKPQSETSASQRSREGGPKAFAIDPHLLRELEAPAGGGSLSEDGQWSQMRRLFSDRRIEPGTTAPLETDKTILLKNGPEQVQFSTLISMFNSLSEVVDSEQMIDLYYHVFQGDDRNRVLPMSVLTSVMRVSLRNRDGAMVKQLWSTLFEAAENVAVSDGHRKGLPDCPRISARYSHILSSGLQVMIEYHVRDWEAAGLSNLFAEIAEAGYEIDSRNWNSYIQAMLKLRQYHEAFSKCEEMLMPNWTGWHELRTLDPAVANRIPIEERRMRSTMRYRRPLQSTLFRLAKGHNDLASIAHLSPDAASLLQEIDEKYERTRTAIKSLVITNPDQERALLTSGQFDDEMPEPDRAAHGNTTVDEIMGRVPARVKWKTIDRGEEANRAYLTEKIANQEAQDRKERLVKRRQKMALKAQHAGVKSSTSSADILAQT